MFLKFSQVSQVTLVEEDSFGVFQNEAWMLAVLEHPRIIKLIGLTMRPKKTLIMEWMELGDLRDFLSHQPSFDWTARLCVLMDVCMAMDFAHRLNPPIIHKE
jgi:serine/threonine protein kinase